MKQTKAKREIAKTCAWWKEALLFFPLKQTIEHICIRVSELELSILFLV